jgi:nitrite reductase (NO-forming)
MMTTVSAGTGGVDPRANRGARGRVATVHEQTRRGLAVALGFGVAAVVIALTKRGEGWWAPLHLFVVGALLSAISATTQMLAVTWSSAPAPARAAARTQRWLLTAGAVGLVAGHERDTTWLFVAGGGAVIAAMLALVPILLRIRQQAVTRRFAPAIEAYAAAVVAGAVGMSLGLVLGTGRGGTRTLELRGAHLILNLLGLVGLVVAATLPYFTATQVRAKMSRRATPARIRLALGVLVLATAVAAIARVTDRPWLVAVALGGYALGLLGITTLLPIHGFGWLQWGGPRVVQLLLGVAWWVSMTVALAVAIARGSSDRAVLQALVIGGFAQILVASLAYLGPVLRGGGHRRLTAGFAITRSWPSVAAGNAAAVAALAGQRSILLVATVVWVIDIVVRAVLLATARRETVDV